ncbi:MAG TPA: 4Fe-4S binding protein [Geminicoccaceae bacterium]
MKLRDKEVLVCNCEVSMALDGRRLADALAPGEACAVHTQLCRAQLDRFRSRVAEGGPLLVGCTQEAPLFEEVRNEFGPDADVRYTNIRERAGWAEEGGAALPKIAALLAEAALDVPPTPTVTLESQGTCLVYGRGQAALDAARQLQDRLQVTLLLLDALDAIPPWRMEVPVYQGRIRQVAGHIGAFEVVIDRHAPAAASSRDAFRFERAADGVQARADLVLDLSGGAPLVTAPDKRDGYLRPDPADPVAVQRAMFELTDLVGEFEKPRYVDFDARICVHSRNGRTGCTRCLEVCPAGAIEPHGDTVRIDPYICGGCGACHSVCPTGAAGYDFPKASALLERLRTLLGTYRGAGGPEPVLLAHDERHGAEVISLISRFGRGLPARVLPFALNEATQLGLDVLLGAFAYGAGRVLVLVPPKRRDELAGLQAQAGHVDAILAGLGFGRGRLELLVEDDPEAVEARLHDLPEVAPAMPASTYLPAGGKRTLMRLAIDALHEGAPEPRDVVPLPLGAPFGRALVDTAGCTLCLACVSVCPTGAFRDDPERPQLAFQEEACVQCGLCVATCPERVISLEPRLNFTPEAKRAVVVKEEEPATCIRCGKPFGTRASIEKIARTLADRHWMFQDTAAVDRIRMCEDCRVIVQFETRDNPLAAGERPRPRTTDDYLREREEIEAARRRAREERGEND